MGTSAASSLLKELRKFWLQEQPQGRGVVAVSGGVDSMVLLEALARVEPTRLLVAHVNHGLRGAESDGDERLVLQRAGALGIPVVSTRLDWGNEIPSQDLCRRRREEFFLSHCASREDRIWLAHHLNDQAETVFARLLRGTGAKGLRGMLPVNGPKVRPFLSFEKTQLLAIAEEWGVVWREDSSNLDPEKYERNWLRGIFPLLEKRRPGFQSKLAALASEARTWSFERKLDIHEHGGVRFARASVAPTSGELADAFALSRRHANGVAALWRKSGGKYEAEKMKFTWSAGLLLCEKGEAFSASLECGERHAESLLGRWEISPELKSSVKVGDSRKKEFQALRVPLFFRSGIPVVEHHGRCHALLPKRIEARKLEVRYAPSPLAAWWLQCISTDP